MRHLMTEHAEVLGSDGHGIVSRIDGAIASAFLGSYSNKMASSLAETSSMMNWGTVSLRRTLRVRQSNDFNWWQ